MAEVLLILYHGSTVKHVHLVGGIPISLAPVSSLREPSNCACLQILHAWCTKSALLIIVSSVVFLRIVLKASLVSAIAMDQCISGPP